MAAGYDRETVMLKRNWNTSSIVMTLCIVSIVVSIIYRACVEDSRLDYLNQQYDKLTQKRGHDWAIVDGALDSIYFISFAGDTTWYVKADSLQ
jgi:hypothetical protein